MLKLGPFVSSRKFTDSGIQNPLPPPPPLPPPLDPPPPDPDELGLDDMLLAAALDMFPMLDVKLVALKCPVPPVYQLGGSR